MSRSSQTVKIWTLILLSLPVGLILMFLRFPPNTDWLQPLWVVLISIYWALMKPNYVSVGTAWLVGIYLDILYNAPIGENALALSLIVFLVVKFCPKITLLGFWKSSPIIFGLTALYQLLRFIMEISIGTHFNIRAIFGNAAISALIWPLLALILFNCQRKLRI